MLFCLHEFMHVLWKNVKHICNIIFSFSIRYIFLIRFYFTSWKHYCIEYCVLHYLASYRITFFPILSSVMQWRKYNHRISFSVMRCLLLVIDNKNIHTIDRKHLNLTRHHIRFHVYATKIVYRGFLFHQFCLSIDIWWAQTSRKPEIGQLYVT